VILTFFFTQNMFSWDYCSNWWSVYTFFCLCVFNITFHLVSLQNILALQHVNVWINVWSEIEGMPIFRVGWKHHQGGAICKFPFTRVWTKTYTLLSLSISMCSQREG